MKPSSQPASSAFTAQVNNDPIGQFDSRFTIADKPSRFFNVGRVFKTLWVEPAGATNSSIHQPGYNSVGYGQFSYSKVRRFVVIRKRLHSCLCLAIHTYGGQGALKSDVRSQDHAVVYSSREAEPKPLPYENITTSGFAVVLEEPGETIAPMSRIDFGKIYTVEHNLKILRVGRVHPGHLPRLEEVFIEALIGPRVKSQGPESEQELEPQAASEPEPEPLHEVFDTLFQITWNDHNLYGAFFPQPRKGYGVREGYVYQPGTVFSAIDKGLRYIFIVLQQDLKESKCITVQRAFGPGYSNFGSVAFCDQRDPVRNEKFDSSVTYINIEDNDFLSTAVASCLNYEKVYAIGYDVDTRVIGVVDPRSLGKLRQDFYNVNFERLHQEQSQMNRRFSSSISKVSSRAATPKGTQAGTETTPPAFFPPSQPYFQEFLPIDRQPGYRREYFRAAYMPHLLYDRPESSTALAQTLTPDLLQGGASQPILSTQQHGNGNDHPTSQLDDTLLEDYFMVPSTNQKTIDGLTERFRKLRQ
ncbi:hypothetical protein IFR05_014638 [Cadophora sp. M221]|nr:hypothetical protein IFR05_014638 [Cadophora sp. M221]